MIFELISLILNEQTGKLAKSTWKAILGVAIGVTLMLFITSKLDSFIVNMEDYMLNFFPEVQFQRTQNSFPVALKRGDNKEIEKLFEGDPEILTSGSAFVDIGIYQIEANDININRRCLLFSGLITESTLYQENYLLNIKPYLELNQPIKLILADDSNQVIISKKLKVKFFGNKPAIGKTIKLGIRTAKKAELIPVVVSGIYNNSSVDAIFLSKTVAAKIIKKNEIFLHNTYIVRLKDKYLSQDWRKELFDHNIMLRDQARFEQEILLEDSNLIKKQLDAVIDKDEIVLIENLETSSQDSSNDIKQSEVYKKWEYQYNTAKQNLDFLQPFQVQSWMDISPENLQHLKMTRVIMLIIFSAVLVLTGLSIKFLLDTIILEKRRQIAILKVLGCSNTSLLMAFLFSGATIGSLGIIFGSITGFGLNWLTALVEQSYFVNLFDFQYRNILPTASFTMQVILLTMGLCVLSSILPAWSVMKIQPIDGLNRDN